MMLCWILRRMQRNMNKQSCTQRVEMARTKQGQHKHKDNCYTRHHILSNYVMSGVRTMEVKRNKKFTELV